MYARARLSYSSQGLLGAMFQVLIKLLTALKTTALMSPKPLL